MKFFGRNWWVQNPVAFFFYPAFSLKCLKSVLQQGWGSDLSIKVCRVLFPARLNIICGLSVSVGCSDPRGFLPAEVVQFSHSHQKPTFNLIAFNLMRFELINWTFSPVKKRTGVQLDKLETSTKLLLFKWRRRETGRYIANWTWTEVECEMPNFPLQCQVQCWI